MITSVEVNNVTVELKRLNFNELKLEIKQTT